MLWSDVLNGSERWPCIDCPLGAAPSEESGAERSDVWSGAKFFVVGRGFVGWVSRVSVSPVLSGQVASMSCSLFGSLLAIGEPGAKGWFSSCRVTTESYIIEL